MNSAFISRKCFESQPTSVHIKFSDLVKIESKNKHKLFVLDEHTFGYLTKSGEFFFLIKGKKNRYEFENKIPDFVGLSVDEISKIIESESGSLPDHNNDVIIYGTPDISVVAYNWHGNFLPIALKDQSFNVISNNYSIRTRGNFYHAKSRKVVHLEQEKLSFKEKWLAVYKESKKILEDTKFYYPAKTELFFTLSDDSLFKAKIKENAEAKGCRFSQLKF